MGTPYVPPTFKPPTQEELAANPSYQFRLGQGQDALQRAAAAKGVLRTGGTLQDLLKYGQDYASQEYENASNRYRQDYGVQQQNAMDKWRSDWEQYVFANTPRGGGGGRGGEDIPPPPEAPDYGPPDEGDPYAPQGGGGPNPGGQPYGRDRGDYY